MLFLFKKRYRLKLKRIIEQTLTQISYISSSVYFYKHVYYSLKRSRRFTNWIHYDFQHNPHSDWWATSLGPGSRAVLLFCCRVTSARMEESELLSCWENQDPDEPRTQTRTYKQPVVVVAPTAVSLVATLPTNDSTKWWKKSTGSKCLQSTERRSPWWEMVVYGGGGGGGGGKTETRRMFVFVIASWMTEDHKLFFQGRVFVALSRKRWGEKEIGARDSIIGAAAQTASVRRDGCRLIKKRWGVGVAVVY